MAISKAERIKLSKLESKLIGIVRHGYTFVDLMKTILYISIVAEKKYTEKFVATRAVYIEEDMMVSDLLTGISA